MTLHLFPRLPRREAQRLAEGATSQSPTELAVQWDCKHPRAEFTASGFPRATDTVLKKLRAELLTVAEQHRYPNELRTAARAEVDCAWAEVLSLKLDAAPGEMGRVGFWQFLTCVLAPDLVRWRWLDGNTERYLDGRRNAFWRVWQIAHVLRSGSDIRLMRESGAIDQDLWQQLIERTSLASCRRLSRLTLECFLDAQRRMPNLSTPREWYRDVQKRLVRLSSFVSFETIDDAQLMRLAGKVVLESGAAFRDARALGGGNRA